MTYEKLLKKYFKNDKKTLTYINNKCVKFLKGKNIYTCSITFIKDDSLRIDFLFLSKGKNLIFTSKMYVRDNIIMANINVSNEKFEYILENIVVCLHDRKNFIKSLKDVCNEVVMLKRFLR